MRCDFPHPSHRIRGQPLCGPVGLAASKRCLPHCPGHHTQQGTSYTSALARTVRPGKPKRAAGGRGVAFKSLLPGTQALASPALTSRLRATKTRHTANQA
eukprot:2588655-Alexandrium_andersonii.AAC.1